MNRALLESAKNGTKRIGKIALIKHLVGKKLTKKYAIYAKCYDCNGMGEQDTCDNGECSLHPYSPYRSKPSKSLGGELREAGEKIKAS